MPNVLANCFQGRTNGLSLATVVSSYREQTQVILLLYNTDPTYRSPLKQSD